MSKPAEPPYPEGHPLHPFRTLMVTGYHDWTDGEFVYRTLSKLRQDEGCEAIITSDDTGVAAFAREWAQAKLLPLVIWPTNYAKHGDNAAFHRAHMMLKKSRPTLLVCFPGGQVTDWLAANAERSHIRVHHVKPPKSSTRG